MKKIIISLTTIFVFQLNAQMKVGSNPTTIHSNANIQVESTSGQQFTITKDSSKVGIGTLTPAAKLDVIGTVKITDGSQGNGKILVSDANGLASWKNASTIQVASTDSTSASNGLTLSGKDVQLGGTLTKATTITTTTSNTIALAGLQSGASTDSILVVNPSTGIVRNVSPATLGSSAEPWFNVATLKGANANTQNIYQMGKVGINTNNPLEQLDVNGNINQRGYTYLRKLTGNTSAFIWTNFNAGGDKINYSFNYQNADGTDSVYNSGYGTNTFSQGNSGFFFNTSNGVNGVAPTTNVMYINTVGRVGINTQNPSAKLHVVDTANNTPLRLEGLAIGNVTTDSVLVATNTGVVKQVSAAKLGSASEPWFGTTTGKGATSNTENIYQLGNVGIGTNSINANAVLDLNSSNKGFLIPRLALSATNNASPLSAHVAGMIVYNTATAGSNSTAVSPGLYVNDGTKWSKMVTSVGFVPAVLASASQVGSYTINDASGSNKCRLSSVNINDGNYNSSTYEYTVTSSGTYSMALTLGYLLNNNSGNNSHGIFAIQANSAGTIIKSVRLESVINFGFTGSQSTTISIGGSAIFRPAVGDRLYFVSIPCNGCIGTYTIVDAEGVIQKISN